tara:strand:- start:6371 stop:6553 length:183 start_codon:yes stop_codon:yes gene_type:complete
LKAVVLIWKFNPFHCCPIYGTEGTTSEIFYRYLTEFSKYKPEELKIIIIDNAGFYSMKNY